MAVTSALPQGSPVKRRDSSVEITTTSSRPSTVTCWGPLLRTRRTSSLRRASASCNAQWSGRAARPGAGIFGDRRFFLVIPANSIPIAAPPQRHRSPPGRTAGFSLKFPPWVQSAAYSAAGSWPRSPSFRRATRPRLRRERRNALRFSVRRSLLPDRGDARRSRSKTKRSRLCTVDPSLDVYSEITCDDNYNHHDANDVENTHVNSPSRSRCENLYLASLAHSSVPVIGIPLGARSISGGIPPVIIPAAIGRAPLLVVPICFMMTDGTSRTGPKETMSNHMPCDTADHRSFCATGRLRRARRQTNNRQHGSCCNEYRLHNISFWIAHCPGGPQPALVEGLLALCSCNR
jgi:hypothetical protein